ncbi:hypothetical protein BS333_21300 (plasmid) [Vibrio azureus]|uniref:Uncharacterized protein n=1 Tax=Vibrio azureus NBRC 104587 TaxID=1219077 RepID=U3A8B1_9VIBR|nr:hypothetical protein [Vibrio azureus]AUI88919.1 hypothetical protein BS333_21300 [Vibrio azureus]GAD76186.1 hypothetical protein VAZ01S_039_00110 [Vibrio azureus NBRC 104587]
MSQNLNIQVTFLSNFNLVHDKAENLQDDKRLGDVLNQRETLNCSHCDFHEVRNLCEFIDDYDMNISCEDLSSAFKAHSILEQLRQELKNKPYINASSVTELKLILLKKEVLELFNLIFLPKGTCTFHYIHFQLLDAKFNQY